MAVSDEPLRIMDTDEAQAWIQSNKVANESHCSLCGSAILNSSHPIVVAEYGAQAMLFCQVSHATESSRSLMSLDSMPASVPNPSSSYSGSNAAPQSPVFSFGTKKVLYTRVVFADDSEVPITADAARSDMDKVNDFYVEASYNKTALITTIPPLLTLPQGKMYYAVSGPGALSADARAAAKAEGYDADNYDLFIVRHTTVPGFTWGGLGGGGTAWLQASGPGTAAHEIGHNYGLAHANYWTTRRDALPKNPNNLAFDVNSMVGHDSIIGPGDDVAYGDPYDVMGSGGGEGSTQGDTNVISSLNGHFNVVGKYQLGWLPLTYINEVTQSGTNRIYTHDTTELEPGNSYALVIRKDEERNYWVSARSRFQNVTWLQNGVELHWGPWQQALGYSQLLDTTPGSKDGSADSALQIGHTFSDTESDIHITPIAKGGSGTKTWFDVVVNVGPFSNNIAPVVQFSASAEQIAIAKPVTFTAAASDANSDRLSYFWNFGDGTYGSNAPTVVKSWQETGDYTVLCEVSDMKGGVTSKHLVIRVGQPETLRVSGYVSDSFGNPLRGVCVRNGALTGNDYGTNYQWTYTDSDGAFTLVNLSTNTTYDVGAYLSGYVTEPLNFDPPISLSDRDAVDVKFMARPLPHVSVKALNDADQIAQKQGTFEVTRTGDTNTAFRVLFLLEGSASADAYQAYTNIVTQTNVNENPFGAITSTFDFEFLDFPTGVFKTNITIIPSTNAVTGADRYVTLTLMNALQDQRITQSTNTNWFSFTGWETRHTKNGDVWFQTELNYVPAGQSDAYLYIRGKAPTNSVVSIIASTPGRIGSQETTQANFS